MTTDIATRKDYKAWARANIKGVEAVVHPSYLPDFSGLDAEGVRIDVRQAIAEGAFAIFASPAGLSLEEYKSVLTIIRDECGDKALSSAVVRRFTTEENLEVLAHAAAIGCSHALLWLPNPPETADAMFDVYANLINSADIGICLYAHRLPAYKSMHPSGLALPVLRDLAALPNVVSAKLTQTLDAVAAMEACDFLADRVMCGSADLGMIPLLSRVYPMQWTGQFLIEAMQSVERPYIVEFMDALNDGRTSEATALYWKIQSASKAFNDLQRPFLLAGSHPWTHLKYYQFLTGGNGGLLRPMTDETTVLDAATRKGMEDSLRAIGIPIHDRPLDEFIVGAANYARGVRPADMASLPCWP
jgi:4-hydroxy-tetrahydrodipicolinate synthase